MAGGLGIARAASIAMALLVLAPAGADAGPRDIVPVGPDPVWACVQDSPPRLSVKTRFGMNASPSFRQAARALERRRQAATRRLRTARSPRARARAQAELRRIGATSRGVARCRAGRLPVPSVRRRSFGFFCLHGYELPSALIDRACAVNLRPRGTPDTAAAAFEAKRTYDQLDVTLGGECGDDGGGLAGPEDMESVSPLYIVSCQTSGAPRGRLPVRRAWDVLGMENEFCNELMGIDEFCGRGKPSPPTDPSPRPRPDPPAPSDDCVVMRMESEFGNC